MIPWYDNTKQRLSIQSQELWDADRNATSQVIQYSLDGGVTWIWVSCCCVSQQHVSDIDTPPLVCLSQSLFPFGFEVFHQFQFITTESPTVFAAARQLDLNHTVEYVRATVVLRAVSMNEM
jgi:hypothetical protein